MLRNKCFGKIWIILGIQIIFRILLHNWPQKKYLAYEFKQKQSKNFLKRKNQTGDIVPAGIYFYQINKG